ncbi:MAG: purine-binding chemotaxis protein CheW [Phycisphaerae bacterium]|nr:purine-binding chemotaxis protein CheW [Phycisphaerae bacterium]
MATVLEKTQTRNDTDAERAKYLTFQLAGEEYGIEILKIREIIGLMDITAVPQMPHYVRGVVNLRGKVIPVVDLRTKFGMESAEYTEQTCIIVVDVGQLTGIIVDTVQEVLDIKSDQVDPPPPLGAGVDTSFVSGMGKVGENVKILLDIDQVLDMSELSAVAGEAATDAAGTEF